MPIDSRQMNPPPVRTGGGMFDLAERASIGGMAADQWVEASKGTTTTRLAMGCVAVDVTVMSLLASSARV